MKQQRDRLIFIRSIFWIAGMLATATVTGRPAEASTIHYTINNNAGMIAPFLNEPVSITGQFSYNPATRGITDFDVTLTTKLEFSGTATDDNSPILISGLGQPKIIFEQSGFAIELFLNDFGGDGAYDIRFIDAHGPADYTLLPTDAPHRPTITAQVGEASVPEPSTRVFALTGGALILSLLWRRRTMSRAATKVAFANLQ